MRKYFSIKNLKINHNSIDGSKRVLELEDLSIAKGKTFGLVGESGAGKTILAQTILGLLPVPPGEIVSGEILLDNENLLKKTQFEMRREIRGKKIAMIFQDPMSSLNPVYTVGYQLMQVIKSNRSIKGKEALPYALEMIENVQLSDGESVMGKYPHQLSGGQRQRIIIAMALSCGAEFIIADEPTRNLDVTIQAGILRLLKDLQTRFEVTVLFIANNLGLISAVCDEVGILYQGRMIEQNMVEKILTKPKEGYTRTLLAAVTPETARKEAERPEGQAAEIVKVSGLKKYFPIRKRGTVKAVDGVDFSIGKGEILGIVGESGCGKSTLVNTLLLLHEATAGNFLFDGKPLFDLNKNELNKTRKDIQIVFQDPYWSLNPRWLVRDIIGEPLKVHSKLNEEDFRGKVGELLKMVGLKGEDMYKYPHEFSGGQRQRIAIARALSVKPKLIVLDEPTSSIDVVSQSQILDLLHDLKEKLDLTYIIISHDLGVVNNMSDKILVMYLGKVIEQGEGTKIFDNPLHPYTQALLKAIPHLETRRIDELSVIKGRVSSAIDVPAGCRFHPRCERAMDICRTKEPQEITKEDRQVSCHLYNGGTV